ncbi:MAG: DUF721 domain-containing protein [Deltaproteobacteria bacterium]|nr:DUF721 domain-containing protein [Deltaproteobacteria bacterium]
MIHAKTPIRIGHVIDLFLDSPESAIIAKGLSVHKIWSKIVGLNISKRTRPLKLSGKILYVIVATSTWMEELKYLKQDIIKKINAEFKEKTVEDIIFRIGKNAEISVPNPLSPACNRQYPGQLPQKELENIHRLANLIKNNELQEIILKAMIANKYQAIHTAVGLIAPNPDSRKQPKQSE